MEVTSRVTDGSVIVVVEGEVDLYSSPNLRHELVHWTQENMLSLIVDLGGVTYMDSSGIATLVEGLQLTTRYGGRLKIARLSPAVQEVFKFAHLDKAFSVFDSVDEALRTS